MTTKLLYHFNGNSLDYSGNDRHLSPIYGATITYPAGKFSNGMSGGQLINLAHNLSSIGTGNFTIEFFVKMEVDPNQTLQSGIFSLYYGQNNTGPLINMDFSTHAFDAERYIGISIFTQNGGSGSDYIILRNSDAAPYIGTGFHHVAIVRTSLTNIDAYIDGSKIGQITCPDTFAIVPGMITIGQRDVVQVIDEFRVSDIAIYTENFTVPDSEFVGTAVSFLAPTKLLYHFNDNANDSSGNALDLTVTGFPAYIEGKFNNGIRGFSSSNYVSKDFTPMQIRDILSDGLNFTIDFYAKANNSNTTVQHIIDIGSELSIGLFYNTSTGENGIKIQNSTTSFYNSDIVGINDSLFHHFALVRNNNNLKLFVDGKIIFQNTNFTTSLDLNNNLTMTIGNSSNKTAFGDAPFLGTLDELRISNMALFSTNFLAPRQEATIIPHRKVAQKTLGNKLLLELNYDAATYGYSAPLGSMALVSESNSIVGRLLHKKGTNDADWESHDISELQALLDSKLDLPTGNSTQYITGDGSLATFPSFGSSDKLITQVYNDTASTIGIFNVVYVDGGHGQLPTIALARANAESTSSKSFGVTYTSISAKSTGYVANAGVIVGLNTQDYQVGDSLWLSPSIAGGVTTTKPSAPNHMVFIGTVINRHPNNGVVDVKIQNGFEIQELHDVQIASIQDNQVLKYDAPNSLWKNETLVKSDVGLGNVPNVDATVASNITQDATHRFVTDTEKTTWNSKQNAIGFTTENSANKVTSLDNPNSTTYATTSAISTALSAKENTITGGTTSQYWRGDKSWQTLDKSAVGLGNVPNVDATVASNITQDSTHRFTTDTEKTTWNSKESAITSGTTSQYWRGDKSWQTLDKSAVGLGNVPNVDATVASNIVQDSTHRFVTDTEKTTWNSAIIPTDTSIASNDIDWTTGTTFYKTIAADTTLTFSNVTAGKYISVSITNSSPTLPYSVTFPNGILCEGASINGYIPPNSSRVFTFIKINTTIYCQTASNPREVSLATYSNNILWPFIKSYYGSTNGGSLTINCLGSANGDSVRVVIVNTSTTSNATINFTDSTATSVSYMFGSSNTMTFNATGTKKVMFTLYRTNGHISIRSETLIN